MNPAHSLRILHVLEATQGGTRRHVLDLVPALQKRGFRNHLVYSPLRYPHFVEDAAALEQLGIPCHCLPMSSRPAPRLLAAAALRLARIIATVRPDVVHCHSTVAGLTGRLAVPLAARLTRGPRVVYTPHCIAFDTSLPPLQRRAARLFEAALAPVTDAFIAVSAHEARLLAHTVAGQNKVHLIRNAVDLTAMDQLMSQSGGDGQGGNAMPAGGRWLVGCFGRLCRQKNQMALLRAWAHIVRRLPGERLLLVGIGPDEGVLRQLANRLHVNHSVDWLGDVYEARPWYGRCEIIAQPSRWEGCPYSVLEAMASFRPVVCTPVGGVPEVVGQTGCLTCAEPVQLAHQILGLAHDAELRAQMGASARQRIETAYGLNGMVQATAGVYLQIMNGR